MILQSEILGVKPAKPGWDEVLVAPHTGDLSQARGVVPTPHGPVSVEWTSDREFSLLVTTPVPGIVRLPPAIREILPLPPGTERQQDPGGEIFYTMKRPGVFRFRAR